jgi:hypothetical protein
MPLGATGAKSRLTSVFNVDETVGVDAGYIARIEPSLPIDRFGGSSWDKLAWLESRPTQDAEESTHPDHSRRASSLAVLGLTTRRSDLEAARRGWSGGQFSCRR